MKLGIVAVLEAIGLPTLAERRVIDAAVNWHGMRFAPGPLRKAAEREMVAALNAVQQERAENAE